MSSLAGALDQPASYNHVPPANPGGFTDQDVDMNAPSSDVLLKEEEDAATISGVLEERVQDEEMEDLFGNDADEKHDVVDAKSDSAPAVTPAESGFESDDLSQTEKEHRQALEYLEPEEPGIVVEQVREADVRIPNIPVPKSSDGDHWAIRMPTFVKMDSKPFHPDTYIGPEHDEDDNQHNENVREKSMSIKLKVENTVRWRWTKDEFGQDKRQSNSRVIRWSDGSLSLRLGKELFDITKTVDTSGGVVRQSLGGTQPSQASQSQPAASQNMLPSSRSQGLTYLVAQHKRSEVLQAETVVTGYMTLRPTGMQSETHRMLVRAVGQKHNKVARLRMAPDPTMDPEREKMELMRQSARKSKKKTDDSGLGVHKKRYSQSRKRQGHDIWSEDEEEPEYEGSEDDDDIGASKRKADEQRKRGPGEYQEDDFVVADESDDDAEFDGEVKPRKKRKHRDAEEEDPLDQLDAKIIQRQQDDRKRKHQDSGNDRATTEGGEDGAEEDDDQDMDIESEEEEEEHRVRKAGSGARKKRTMALDDDEEE
ncbi:Leo1-like protein-domain-containing protein [Suillus paluster]|uniref:Leo1-like protein-domain-containing protein n=1 Tax=Suillus paluster TaxID=48578 RepID=UPI001B8714C1|nr:Leo1-like protein-domain-containing protein [Suillus paluster]KAG1746701.1 Leo1-like protein-domain-containing protein [Suillus paluster]